MFDSAAPRTVQCYHCRKAFDVPARAMSISCPWCYQRVTLDDMVIKDTCWTSKVQTCGRVHVKKKGVLVASLVEACEGIYVEGVVDGNIVCHGPVHVGPKARIKGTLKAPSIQVEPGGEIDGGFLQIASERPTLKATGVSGTQAQIKRPLVVIPGLLKGLRPAH